VVDQQDHRESDQQHGNRKHGNRSPVVAIRELSATILLYTARTKTIAVTMFDLGASPLSR
jgi:hypothetical protein